MPRPVPYRFAALLLLLAVAATIQASPYAIPLVLAEAYPKCTREQVGQPCPGVRASECLDLGPEMEPRCVSRCKETSDCAENQDCLRMGETGPMRCVPRGFLPPPKKGC